ncbi:MAG: hypothetical protein HKN82_10870 [Akkermansiaceae bacterium]|nr:hypothetical protein [Akkermansiaceae bacterium]
MTPTAPPPNPSEFTRLQYPWHQNITATVFWIGEKPSGRNRTSNHHSSWDRAWQKNYGGFDNPDPQARANFCPKGFVPRLNPFYIALPYNDCVDHRAHKPEAASVIPWFNRYKRRPGRSVCRGRWVQLVYKGKTCYAQWEDCGPFLTDDWRYVFGRQRPANSNNGRAGIDVSPAVRDFLGLKSHDKVHWRFVEIGHVPRGPWASLGKNNPFVNPDANPDLHAARRYNDYLRRQRDAAYQRKKIGS